ncbi:MAG TPA: hypothetical protein VJG65_03675 [Patescibacteria group bacterium]|nr:hypothetical protein [Patescibacteria group bacterium]
MVKTKGTCYRTSEDFLHPEERFIPGDDGRRPKKVISSVAEIVAARLADQVIQPEQWSPLPMIHRARINKERRCANAGCDTILHQGHKGQFCYTCRRKRSLRLI